MRRPSRQYAFIEVFKAHFYQTLKALWFIIFCMRMFFVPLRDTSSQKRPFQKHNDPTTWKLWVFTLAATQELISLQRFAGGAWFLMGRCNVLDLLNSEHRPSHCCSQRLPSELKHLFAECGKRMTNNQTQQTNNTVKENGKREQATTNDWCHNSGTIGSENIYDRKAGRRKLVKVSWYYFAFHDNTFRQKTITTVHRANCLNGATRDYLPSFFYLNGVTCDCLIHFFLHRHGWIRYCWGQVGGKYY